MTLSPDEWPGLFENSFHIAPGHNNLVPDWTNSNDNYNGYKYLSNAREFSRSSRKYTVNGKLRRDGRGYEKIWIKQSNQNAVNNNKFYPSSRG